MKYDASFIFAVTQSVLAIIVVVGAGLLLAKTDIDPAILIGVASLVIGYFFGSAVQPAGVRRGTGDDGPAPKSGGRG